jgi:histidinol-phosphate/aromatic aminotransferase/cobyric acid decarboxylase-like protein/choline kinase
MKAIILAAGVGSRLRPLTEDSPKCLTKVNNRPILANTLDCLERSPVTDVIIVVGYLEKQIRDFAGSYRGRLKVHYVRNAGYSKTGTAASLRLALREFSTGTGPLLILEGDVLFEQSILDGLLSQEGENVTVVERYHPPLDGTFVRIDPEHYVTDWWHLSQRSGGFVREGKFKTVNLHRFAPGFVGEDLLPALEDAVSRSAGKAPLEYAMREIVRGKPRLVRAMETRGRRWCEIDDLSDLRRAEDIFGDRIVADTQARIDIETLRGFHGGYWRHEFLDFHYLHNPYFPPPEMVATLKADLPHLICHYPSAQHRLAGFLAGWKEAEYFRKEHLVVGNGSSELIRILGSLITPMTVPVPTFNEYLQFPAEKLNIHHLPEENGFRLNFSAFAESILRSGSPFAVLCNPNNPAGDVCPRADIESLLRQDVTLIIDEAFIDWAGPGYSCEEMVERYRNLVVLKSMTKVAGIPGLRLGYMLTSNEALSDSVRKALPIWNVNAIAERFIELFPEYAKEFDESLRKGRADRGYLMARLKEVPFLEPFESCASFILCRSSIPAKVLGRYLYECHSILIRDSLNQAIPTRSDYIRVAVRPAGDVDRLVEGLREAAEQITGRYYR